MRLTRRRLLGVLGGAAALPVSLPAETLDVRQFGALGDGVAVNTEAIQKAIDAATTGGGGTVLVAGGNFVTGTLFLKSNVTLWIDAGASLRGSPKIADYATGTHRNMYAGEPYLDRCLIFARDAENVGLQGAGTIDGQGKSFPNAGDAGRNRPMMLRLMNCRNVVVRDLTLQNPAGWTSAFLYCTDIHVDGVAINSKGTGNGDGLDFDGCQNVRIANCRLDNGDDSISLQSSEVDKPVRNVLITNCIMSSRWAAIRIGLLSRGVFEDIVVSNCVFQDIGGEALKIQMAEGGQMNNFLFSNIAMKNVPRPVFITFNSFRFRVDSPRELPPMQSMKNMTFSDIRVESGSDAPDGRFSFFAVLGLPDHPIEDITFNNISFIAPGGGTREDAAVRSVPELADMRPERKPLGTVLPSYGVYARHVRNLTLSNMTLRTDGQDFRPGVVCSNVEDLTISNVRVGGDADAPMLLTNTKHAVVQGCAALNPGPAFLRVEGADSREIALTGNDLRRSKRVFDRADDVPGTAVAETGNLR